MRAGFPISPFQNRASTLVFPSPAPLPSLSRARIFPPFRRRLHSRLAIAALKPQSRAASPSPAAFPLSLSPPEKRPVEMDPRLADAFARFLQDPAATAALSQSLSQPASLPPLPAFPYPPLPFPPFCTQPLPSSSSAPPAVSATTDTPGSTGKKATPSLELAAGSAATCKPSSSSRAGRRHRVTTTLAPSPAPGPEDESGGKTGKMLYSHEEDIRLVRNCTFRF
ncbi:hypothetical protein OsJ_01423 [Oryza sativa Japonica Group]|uniref:Uncharacterized protein n=1 Tax=Oryza sativa subsp. japonica TaxID=39947 RepID=B9EVQ0_ORYSJ|nr:hypothetical protein OsJ_01423 [Oryza sativa Japonica Group]